MKHLLFIGIILSLFACTQQQNEEPELVQKLSDQLNVLVKATNDSEKVPRSWDETNGYKMIGQRDWCSGFPAGSYWSVYELTGDEQWKNVAVENTEKLEGVQFYTGTHDLGFMVFCSYGNAYRITGNEKYKQVILQARKA